MRTVLLIRHGSTKLNNDVDFSADRIRAWKDVPLSDDGKREALAMAQKLRDSNIAQIISSDLLRARDTAHVLGRAADAPVELTQKLRPWNLGDFTGTSTKDALPKIATYVTDRPNEPVPNGESFNNFKERAFGGIWDALSQFPEGLLALVTHHRVERLLKAWNAQGQLADLAIHIPTFLQKGEAPAVSERFNINSQALRRAFAPTMEELTQHFGAQPTLIPVAHNPFAESGTQFNG